MDVSLCGKPNKNNPITHFCLSLSHRNFFKLFFPPANKKKGATNTGKKYEAEMGGDWRRWQRPSIVAFLFPFSVCSGERTLCSIFNFFPPHQRCRCCSCCSGDEHPPLSLSSSSFRSSSVHTTEVKVLIVENSLRCLSSSPSSHRPLLLSCFGYDPKSTLASEKG